MTISGPGSPPMSGITVARQHPELHWNFLKQSCLLQRTR